MSQTETRPFAAWCEGVVRLYWSPTGEVHALKGVDAAFPAGAVTAVVGPSGSGKSSLLRILGGLDQPTAGTVRVGDVDLTGLSVRRLRALRRRRIGYVFQRPSHNLIPYLTAIEHVDHAAALRGAPGEGSERRYGAHARRADRGESRALLARLGLESRAHARPNELSGGEQQRLALAQAVVGAPDLVLADEPTAELDTASGAALLELVREVASSGTAVVLTTHDLAAQEVADQTLWLHHGALQAERVGSRALTVIDGIGRLQLPPEAVGLFPDRRAVVTVVDGELRITPP